ncbi:MAG: hypothetical protein ACUVWR_00780 [Anaerolineae bacterium]
MVRERLSVGVSAVDIAKEGVSSPDDPVYAKAVVFRQGNQQAALVICDLIGVAGEANTRAREVAARESSIPVDNICLSATHTHSNRERPQDFVERVARAVVQAQAAAEPVKLEVGKGYRDDISFNRRFLMRDGMVMMNPGLLNPDIVRPVGPIDPEVSIVLFRDGESARPLASLTSFALHLCTNGANDRKADYAYWLERSLREELGEGFISVFAEGCCEDINHVDVNRPHPDKNATRNHRGQFMLYDYVPRETDAAPSLLWDARYLGEALAAEIKAQVPKLREERPSLAVRSAVVPVPLATYSDMDLQWAKEANYQEASWLMQFRIDRILGLEKLRSKYGETLPLTVQVFRLGEETAVVALPGQVFVELGLAIKKASPFTNTLVMELANEWEYIAILPPRKSFCEGHFEIIASRLECGGGELLVDAAVCLLNDIKDLES